LQSKDPAQLTMDEWLVIDQVLSSLERTWILIEYRQIDRKFIYKTYGVAILRVWSVTRDIVMYERSRRGSYYRQRTEKLAKATKKYFKSHNKQLDYPVVKLSTQTISKQASPNQNSSISSVGAEGTSSTNLSGQS
ncbi:MAG: hypothetical protein AAF267_23030, partial [Deinococcota bacterium]